MAKDFTTQKVSIIISTYNGAKYIAETIESVQSQTYQNWELIVIDDGSKDNTCEIVSSVKDERIQLFSAERTRINGKIKNIGLSKISGELVAFIDHDDLWAPSKLEKQVNALQQYPDAGFSITGGYNFKKPGEPLEYFYPQKEGIKYDNIFISFFRSEIAGFTQALLVRKECIAVAGNFRETGSFSDVGFIVNLAQHFKAVIIYEPLIYRRIHGENFNQSNWEKSNYEGIEIIKMYKKLLPVKIAREALFRVNINFGEQYLEHEAWRKAINRFADAWKNKPLSMIPLKKTAKAILYSFKK